MPPAPELRDILRKVGRDKIGGKGNPEQSGTAEGNKGISCKVTVNLYGVKKGSDGQPETVKIFRRFKNK